MNNYGCQVIGFHLPWKLIHPDIPKALKGEMGFENLFTATF
jgi:hypothetical protein